MITFNKSFFTVLLSVMVTGMALPQTPGITDVADKVITFRFEPGSDMFYTPWNGNGEQLEALHALIDEYHTEIISGNMPIHVDGYCASLGSYEENFSTAVTRSNRVKSELITNKQLTEECFITKNHASAYEGHRDIVVVTLSIPVELEFVIVKYPPMAIVEEEEHEQVKQPEQVRTPEPVVITEPAPRGHFPYCFAVRTNILYDALLTPTLGIEWRMTENIGIKLDGSYSFWGDEHGNVQKIWLVSPEVRWYMGGAKRFYVGAGANFGEYNIYKGMIGGMFEDNRGYQGKVWSAGVTVGYQLYLSPAFSIDFNLGLGYLSLDYDIFTVTESTRVIVEKDKSKGIFSPTQAGVSLIWTIGGKK